MKKGRNSEGSFSLSLQNMEGERRFTLPKSKILRGRTNFDRLFDDKAVVFNKKSVLIRFRIYVSGKTDCKMAFIVPKRLGKAVQRKQSKRHLREAYRLNQYILADEISLAACVFHGALMAKTIDAGYEPIKTNVIDLLKQTKWYINKAIER